MKVTPRSKDEEIGGFSIPEEGKWLAVVSGVENFVRESEEEQEKRVNRYRIQFQLLEGPSEGASVSAFFNMMTSAVGPKMDLLRLIEASGIADTIAKKYSFPPIQEGWEDTILESKRLLNELSSTLVGKKLYVTIKHVKSSDGRTFANIVKFDSVGEQGNDQVQVDASNTPADSAW